MQTEETTRVTRAEWIAAAALVISILQGAYVAGIEVQRLNDHDRRLANMEEQQDRSAGKIEQLLVTVARIDANVSTLTDDRARERQQKGN